MDEAKDRKFANYIESLMATMMNQPGSDAWIEGEGDQCVARCSSSELGILRLEHRFRVAKTALAHQSYFDESGDEWLFSIALNELKVWCKEENHSESQARGLRLLTFGKPPHRSRG